MALATSIAARSRGVGFYITGWEVSATAFAAEAAQVGPRAKSITDSAAQMIERDQRASAPARSGKTRDSIENTVEEHPDGYARSVGPTHFVSRFLVFGTVKMPPQWDLFGASQAGVEWWEDRMSEISTL